MKHIKPFSINESMGITLKCIKDLYKSTYQGLAFTKDKEYVIDAEEDHIYMIDNENNLFSFSKITLFPYYYIGDYFDIKDLDLKFAANKYNI